MSWPVTRNRCHRHEMAESRLASAYAATSRPYRTDAVPPGPRQAQEAEKVRTRFLNQVDEGRNPKTRANVEQLMTMYLDILDVNVLTLRGYRSK